MTEDERLDELVKRARRIDPDLRLFIIVGAIIIAVLLISGEIHFPPPQSSEFPHFDFLKDLPPWNKP